MPIAGGYGKAEVEALIATHAALATVHHAKTTKASEITSEAFDDDRIPAGIARDAEVIEAVGDHAVLTDTHGVTTAIADTDDIAEHAALPTVHQDAPDLILTHKGDVSAHHVKYTDVNAVSAMGAKADDNPLNHDKTPVASGSYTGNDTVNRAIPHGLGVTPKLVIIEGGNDDYKCKIVVGSANIYYIRIDGSSKIAVTALDATNFYVGNAADYAKSANYATKVYYWVAIGG